MKKIRVALLGIPTAIWFLSFTILSGALLSGCSNLGSVGVSGGHNAQTGDISGSVEITFKDANGNTIVRRYPRNHPAVQHLIANP